MAVTLVRPLTTLADVKRECGMKQADTGDDDKINTAINLTTEEVEKHLRRDFDYHDHSATPFSVPQSPGWIIGRHIYLPWPIITLTAIYIDGTVIDNSAADAYKVHKSDTAYSWRASGRIDYSTDWPLAPVQELITIDGTFGYVQTESGAGVPTGVPGSVKRAATLIAAAWSGEYRKEQRSPDNSVILTTDTRMPKEAIALLKPYRRRFI